MFQQIKNIYHYLQAFVSAVFFKFPSKSLKVIAVTGTDGKTTTVNMIHHILTSANKKASMVSSVDAKIGNKILDTGFHVTTPNSWQLQKLLSSSVKSGSEYFILEATSHGLDQNRLAFIDIDTAAITNITQEHMDYHKNWEDYALAKSKLFKNAKFSVLNMDNKSFDFLKSKPSGKTLTYSKQKKSNYNLKNLPIKLKIKGDFNLENALCAASIASIYKLSKREILKSLENFSGVEGRMQKVEAGQSFKAIIDFAHTPNSLENALKTLKRDKASDKSRLIAVFGAAGKRDNSKRKPMGEIASKLADVSIITSEDPRTEDPSKIADEIKSGFGSKKQNHDFFIETDRSKAIEMAVKMAKKGDTVVFFGKGHEKSMCIGKVEYPWDEEKQVKGAILKYAN